MAIVKSKECKNRLPVRQKFACMAALKTRQRKQVTPYSALAVSRSE